MSGRISCGESLSREDWPWALFDAQGRMRSRGADRLSTINRFERSEGHDHRAYCVVKNLHTQEEWMRRRGMWFPRDDKEPATAGGGPNPLGPDTPRRGAAGAPLVGTATEAKPAAAPSTMEGAPPPNPKAPSRRAAFYSPVPKVEEDVLAALQRAGNEGRAVRQLVIATSWPANLVQCALDALRRRGQARLDFQTMTWFREDRR